MNGESTVVPKTEIPPFKYDKNEDNKNKKKRLHIVRICLQDHRLIHPVLVKLNNITTEHAKGCPVT
jgi:hypothetical protein